MLVYYLRFVSCPGDLSYPGKLELMEEIAREMASNKKSMASTASVASLGLAYFNYLNGILLLYYTIFFITMNCFLLSFEVNSLV